MLSEDRLEPEEEDEQADGGGRECRVEAGGEHADAAVRQQRDQAGAEQWIADQIDGVSRAWKAVPDVVHEVADEESGGAGGKQ